MATGSERKLICPAVGILLILLLWDKKLRSRLVFATSADFWWWKELLQPLQESSCVKNSQKCRQRVVVDNPRSDFDSRRLWGFFQELFCFSSFQSKYPGLIFPVDYSSCFFSHLALHHVNIPVPSWNSWSILHLPSKKNIKKEVQMFCFH